MQLSVGRHCVASNAIKPHNDLQVAAAPAGCFSSERVHTQTRSDSIQCHNNQLVSRSQRQLTVSHNTQVWLAAVAQLHAAASSDVGHACEPNRCVTLPACNLCNVLPQQRLAQRQAVGCAGVTQVQLVAV